MGIAGKEKKIKKILVMLLIILGILLQPISVILSRQDIFFSRGYFVTYPALKSAYNASQYAQKKNPISMSDADFEQFAAGIFLKGLNPILIVHDHPPLGRYIISLSIIIFDNPHTIMLPLLLLSGVAMYLLSRIVIRHELLAFIPVGIFINEPMFIGRLTETPLPEPIQLPFIFLAFYFFIKGISDGSGKYLYYFLATSFMLGIVISTRFFILGLAMTGCMGLYLLLTERLNKKTWYFVATLPLMGVVLILTYFRTLQLGASVIDIVKIQRYILDYHKSKFILPFTMWDLLLFNRWHTWWGNRAILSDPQWSIFWPVAAVTTISSVVYGIRKHFELYSVGEKVLLLWVSVHILMLSTGYTSSRYFLSLIPLLYILATAFLIRLLTRRKETHKA